MSKGKQVIGILLIVTSIAALVFWEKWGKSRFLYEEITVMRENVPTGTIITEDLFETITWPQNDKEAITSDDIPKLIGKVASQDIRRNTPVYDDYFEEDKLIVSGSDDKYIMKIPTAWIESCPDTIARSCRGYFYSEGKFVTSMWILNKMNEEGEFNVIASNEQICAISKIAQKGSKFVISQDRGH